MSAACFNSIAEHNMARLGVGRFRFGFAFCFIDGILHRGRFLFLIFFFSAVFISEQRMAGWIHGWMDGWMGKLVGLVGVVGFVGIIMVPSMVPSMEGVQLLSLFFFTDSLMSTIVVMALVELQMQEKDL